MEIERKYLIKTLPDRLKGYPREEISQAYLCTDPVMRIRRKDEDYIFTVKSGGMMAREEFEFPLPEESYYKLLPKAEGNIIEKTRYRIPDKDGLTIELDIFHGCFEGFIMAEVEFADLNQAESYMPPSWFGEEVTMDHRFHNSRLSLLDKDGIRDFLCHLI